MRVRDVCHIGAHAGHRATAVLRGPRPGVTAPARIAHPAYGARGEPGARHW
ncbi:hypothetical protein SXIM_14140 [Streptomyces xiamenensis]|uniref:Uncharacterized protein n=1 Tax=Streptomyces xiamenensis TaxID=408015 RepID=A0A0F7FS24_9ACTN|nr:hypothetical protein SXIM_14140 [Streptomyces xiamenensis]